MRHPACSRPFRIFRWFLHPSDSTMGNSKDRRKLRRLIQQLGLSMPPTVPAAPQKPVSIPFWRKIPAWGYAAAVLFSIAITLMEGYPWLSIQENAFLDPTDPFSQMFSITNQGYVPLTDVDVDCFPNFQSTAITMGGSLVSFRNVAGYLEHGGTVTIPCFRIPDIFRTTAPAAERTKRPGATLGVVVSYALYHINLKFLRRSQEFHFRSVVGKDGSQHWIFLR